MASSPSYRWIVLIGRFRRFPPIIRKLWAVICACTLAMSVLDCPEVAGQDDPLTAALDRAGPADLLPDLPKGGAKGRSLLRDDTLSRLRQANQRETRLWKKLRSIRDWESYRDRRLEALQASLGTFGRLEADPRVTGIIRGERHRVVKLVFQSRPGLLVTANLYEPRPSRKKMPAIILVHSHHNPKWQGELQDMGVTWAGRGCLVLVVDLLGHGERADHPFQSRSAFSKPFRVGRQDYYFRYDLGLQLHLVGESLIGWMVNDLHRAVDYLVARADVDKEKIIMVGAVAGGGDVCAVAAALDRRIAAAVPFNFGGPEPENRFPLPPNAEESFNYAGSGSWESTRNLRLSARDGFAPWVIVGSIAPRRLIYAHEFAWDRERDPVWRRLGTIYRWYGKPHHLAAVHGRGSVRGRPPESTHCNNVGPVHRKQIYPILERWFDMPNPDPEAKERRSPSELVCLTPPLKATRKRVHQLAGKIAERHLAQARSERQAMSPAERRKHIAARLAPLLGGTGLPKYTIASAKRERFGPVVASRVVLRTEGKLLVPLEVLHLENQAPKTMVIGISGSGRKAFFSNRRKEIESLLRSGYGICLPDLRGTGETSPGNDRSWKSSRTSLSATLLMLGDTLRGGQVRDLRAVIDYVQKKSMGELRIVLWGDSFAPVNRRGRQVVVPRGTADFPSVADPTGPSVAVLTAIFESRISALAVRGGVGSYLTLLDEPICLLPHAEVIPGLVTVADTPDLLAALAPLPVSVGLMVDGQNREMTAAAVKNAMGIAIAAYQNIGKGPLFELAADDTPESRLAWIRKVAK